MRTIAFVIIAFMAAIVMGGLYCTKVDYTNPLDAKGTNYAGDSATLDDNGDGIPNYYDPTWPPNVKLKKSFPKIVFTGPDTVVIGKDDPTHVLSGLTETATDSIWGNLTDSIKSTGNVFTSVCSTFTVVYSVKNPMGYQAQKTRTIIVDCAPPTISLNGDNPLRLKLGTPYVEPGATATDNIDGVLTSKIVITGKVDINHEGVDTVTYTVTDKAGNVGKLQRQVIVYQVVVADTIPPVLTLKGANPMTLMVNGVYIEPGFVAVDLPNYDTLTSKVVVTGLPVITSTARHDTLTYTVKDAANNIASQKRIIIVQAVDTGKDVTPPVITFLVCSVCTTKVGQAWVDPGYTAFDDHDGDVTSKVVKPTQVVNTNVPGVTTLRYTVTDNAGNTGVYVRTVTVVGTSTDTTKPVIHLDGAVQCTVSVGKTFTDPGYSAQDNVDGIITSNVSRTIKNSSGVAADFNTFTNTIDKYTLTYTVSDASGNAAVPALRYVVVKDTAKDTTVNGNLLVKYGVPLSSALQSINTPYKTSVTTDGTGAPNVSSITTFTLDWDLTNSGLYQFSLNLSASPYYANFSPTNTFGAAKPGFTLTGSGITGLDGDYYINASATECDWVRTDGSFAIIFK